LPRLLVVSPRLLVVLPWLLVVLPRLLVVSPVFLWLVSPLLLPLFISPLRILVPPPPPPPPHLAPPPCRLAPPPPSRIVRPLPAGLALPPILLVVSPVICVVVVQLPLLGRIRQWSLLGGVHWCWSSLGGFIVVGLDSPTLVLHRFMWIRRRWGGFPSISRFPSPSLSSRPSWSFAVGWDSPVLVVVGLVLLALALLALALGLWVEFAGVCHHWGGVSRRWVEFAGVGCRWGGVGLDLPALVLQPSWFPSPSPLHVLSFTTWFLPPYPHPFCFSRPLVSPSFAPPSLRKGEGRVRLQPSF
jgi:hypothetical protein